ncbi:MAG: O-antigen ligase family protein [Actinobacteria bacterium]|nr:O-antigen ligase family protein [Actinomycetota bacterium]
MSIAFAGVLGGMVGYLVGNGYWYLALAMLLAPPTAVVVFRYPLAAVMIWLLLIPFVGETESVTLRRVFWLIHRALPPLAVGVIVVTAIVGVYTRRLPRLGWPEVMMTGYGIATALSIAYTSQDLMTTGFVFYDTVVIPMCLYLVVRLTEPNGRDLRRLLPFVIFMLLTQAGLGFLSWKAPHFLPSEWLGKVGERTVGSLRAPEVFGATMIFCGLFVLHAGITARKSLHRAGAVLLFALALLMVFLSFSRSVWLAGLISVIGGVAVCPRLVKYFFLAILPLALAALVSGALAEQTEFAQQRFRSEQSEESALSRLPVVYASIRMFEERPVVGWGYQNFDLYDRSFQGTVGNLVAAEKDHASHNFFLTILAEQGLVGFVLFIGPFAYWFKKSRGAMRKAPRRGLVSRDLIAILCVSLLAFLLVNNFYRMQTAFALGMWWLVMGLVASSVALMSHKQESFRLIPETTRWPA